jgi:hypothetical protein
MGGHGLTWVIWVSMGYMGGHELYGCYRVYGYTWVYMGYIGLIASLG